MVCNKSLTFAPVMFQVKVAGWWAGETGSSEGDCGSLCCMLVSGDVAQLNLQDIRREIADVNGCVIVLRYEILACRIL